MLSHFNSEARKWAVRQKFAQHKQKPNKTVADYISKSRTYFRHLSIPDSEQMHHFISGLLPNLRRYTILQSPKSLSEAETIATLHEATFDNTRDTTTNTIQNLTTAQNKLLDRLATLEGKTQIAAFQNSGAPPSTSSRDNFRTHNKRDSYNFNSQGNPQGPSDFANAVEAVVARLQQRGVISYNNRQRNFQGQNYNQNPAQRDRFSYNARGDFGRSLRITDGRAFCDRCHKIGHSARSCWHNENSQNHRDTRLPQQGYRTHSPQYHPVRTFQLGQNESRNERLN